MSLGLDDPDDELKDLGDTIDDLLGRLERAFEAQRQFVDNAPHELRTPLAGQRTVAQVALDDPAATVESLRAAHERVLAAGAQEEQLIDALLTERSVEETHERVSGRPRLERLASVAHQLRRVSWHSRKRRDRPTSATRHSARTPV